MTEPTLPRDVPLGEDLDRFQRRDTADKITRYSKTDADALGKAIESPQRYDPLELIGEDPGKPERDNQLNTIERQLGDAPALERFSRNPENAALVHDDVERLSLFEQTTKLLLDPFGARAIADTVTDPDVLERTVGISKAIFRGSQSGVAAFNTSSAARRVNQLVKIRDLTNELERAPTDAELAEALGVSPRELSRTAGSHAAVLADIAVSSSPEDLDRMIAEEGDRWMENSDNVLHYQKLITGYMASLPPGKAISQDGFVEWAVSMGVESSPMLLAVMGAYGLGSLAAGPGGGAVLGAVASGAIGLGDIFLEANQTRTAGELLDPDFQARAAVGVIPYVATEFLGIAARPLRRALMGVDRQLLRKATLSHLKATGRAVGGNSFDEGVNEFLQQVVVDWTNRGVALDSAEAWNQALMEGLAGAVVGAQFSTVTEVPAANAAVTERQRLVDSEQQTVKLRELNEALPSIKLRQRSPKKWKQYLQETGLDRTFIYVDAIETQRLLDEGVLTLEDLEMRQGQVNDAVAVNGRLAIRSSVYMDKAANSETAREMVARHGSLTPEGYSEVEQEAIQAAQEAMQTRLAEIQAEMQEVQKRRAELGQAVYESLRTNANQSHIVAQTTATIHANFMTSMEASYGMPLAGDFPLAIVGRGAPTLTEPAHVDSGPMIPTQPHAAPEVEIDPGSLTLPTPEEADAMLPSLLAGNSLPEPAGVLGQPAAPPQDISASIAPSAPPKPKVEYEQSSIDLIANPPVIEPADGSRVKLSDIGTFLTNRHLEKHGRTLDPIAEPGDADIVREALVEELDLQLEALENGKGWYSQDTDIAVRETAKLYPEVAEPDGRAAYLMLAGVFSNGATPSAAWKNASLPFRFYLQEGRFPITREEALTGLGEEVEMTTFKDKEGNEVTKPKSWSQRGEAIGKSIGVLNFLIEREGSPQAAADWLAAEHTKEEINAAMIGAGLKTPRFATKKSLDEGGEVMGYLSVGPKLGPYFNTLFQIDTGVTEEPVVDVWFIRTIRRLTGGLLKGPLDAKTGLVGQPDPARGGAERQFIKDLTNDLATSYALPVEDVQAILWFYEQKLYTALGVRSNSGTNSDGARQLLEDNRIEFLDEREAALGDVAGGSDAEGDVAAGAAPQEPAGQGDTDAPVVQSELEVDLSQKATEADLENLDGNLFRKSGWAALTADNSSLPDSIRAQRNLENAAMLKADLEAEGIPYREVTGHYGTPEPENSFVAIMDEETAIRFGKKHQQDSVLTPSGLVYTSRPRPDTPLNGRFLEGQAAIDSGFYSIAEDGQAFALDLDWDKGPGKPVAPDGTYFLPESLGRPQLPVNERDGMVHLVHWSDVKLNTVDPARAGSGPIRGPDRRAGEMVSFYGINPRENARQPGTGYVKEGGLGPYKHVGKVSPTELYPWFEDPDGLRPAWVQKEGSNSYITPGGNLVNEDALAQEYQKRIKAAGYKGLYITDNGTGTAPLGNVAKLFEPLDVKLENENSYSQTVTTRGSIPRDTIVSEETREPVLWYRGSNADRDADGRTFWSNKQGFALQFALTKKRQGKKPRVQQATLAMENPLVIGPVAIEPDSYWQSNSESIEAMRSSEGHDGILIYDHNGEAMAISEDPGQITERQRFFNQKTDAWHGSPHTFEKFSLTAIGSGEGAQAFGWGLYFAESRGIAEFYRDKLAGQRERITFDAVDGSGQPFKSQMFGKSDAPWRAREIYRSLSDEQVNEALVAYQEIANINAAEKGREASEVDMDLVEVMLTSDISSILEETFERRVNLLLDDVVMMKMKEYEDMGVFAAEGGPSARQRNQIETRARIALKATEAVGLEVNASSGGRLFKVHIPGADEVLNWEATYDNQPPAIQAALAQLWSDAGGFHRNRYINDFHDLVESLYANAGNSSFWSYQANLGERGDSTPFEEQAAFFADVIKPLEERAAGLADRMMFNLEGRDGSGGFENVEGGTLDPGLLSELQDLYTDIGELSQATYSNGNRVITRGGLVYVLGRIERFTEQHTAMMGEPVLTPPAHLTGQELYQQIEEELGSPKAASELLRSYGIPGHRFYDNSSRGRSDRQRYNHVIYDDASIEVIEFFQRQRQTENDVAGRFSYSGDFDFGTASTIELFENANMTTLIHESGHYFLQVFTTLAQSERAPQQMLEDMQTVHRWMTEDNGVSQIFNDDGTYTTDAQEVFARGFEAYFMEGKSPSNSLGDVFARVRRWMVHWYKELRNLNVEMTPEIRDVMDRMLATDEEIAAAKEELTHQALFKTPPPGMTTQQWETYRKIVEREHEAARKKAADRAARDEAKERRSVTKQVREEVEQELEEDFVYQWIQGDTPKIDRDELYEALDGVAPISDFDGTYQAEGGIGLLEAMDLLNAATQEDLLTQLQAAANLDQLGPDGVVQMRVEKRMAEYETSRSEDLAEEAKASLKNPTSSERVAREVAALNKQTGRGPNRWQVANREAKQIAKGRLEKMKVREILRPQQFLAEGRKAARKALASADRAFRTGDLEALQEVADARSAELIADHMFRQANDLANKIESFRAHAMRFAYNKERAKVGEPEINAIDFQLARLDLRKNVTQKERAAGLSVSQYHDLIQQQQQDSLDGAPQPGELLPQDQRLMDERQLHFSELDGSTMMALMDYVTNLETIGKRRRKALDEQAKENLNAKLTVIEESVDRYLKDQTLGRESTQRRGKRRSRIIQKGLNLVRNAGTILQRMDGGRQVGPVYKILKDGIDRAATAMQERLGTDYDLLAEIYRNHYSIADLRSMAEIKYKVGNANVSKAGLVSMALNSGNQGNWQRLTTTELKASQFVTPPDAVVEALNQHMTPEDWAFVNDIWDFIGKYWQEISDLEYRMTGVRPTKVENWLPEGLNVPDGMTGGYFPIMYDSDVSAMASTNEQSIEQLNALTGRGAKAQTNSGHTESRLDKVNEPIDLNLGNVERHIRQVLHDLTHREAVIDAWKVVNSQRFKAALKKKGWETDQEWLDLWLRDIAEGEHTNADDFLQSSMRFLRNTFTISRLGFNIKTALIQPLGMAQSFVVVGNKPMRHGLKTYIQNRRQWVETVLDRSSMMRERVRTMERDMNQITGDLKTGAEGRSYTQAGLEWYVPKAFWMMQKMQFHTVDMPTWIAGYEKKLAEGVSEEDAAKYADWAVNRAQGSGLISDRGMIERGTWGKKIRQSELPKLFTVLGSYFFAKYNVFESEMIADRPAVEDRAGRAMQMTEHFMLLFALEAMVMAAMRMDWSDDDDEGLVWQYLKGWAGETFSTMGGMFPVLRDAVGVSSGFDSTYQTYLAYGDRMLRLGRAGYDFAVEGEGFSRSDYKNAGELLSLAYFPTTVVKRFMHGLMDEEGDMRRDLNAGQFIGDITGVTRSE